MTLGDIKKTLADLQDAGPSAEECFWLYAKAASLDLSGQLDPVIKAHLPLLRHLAQPFMNTHAERWLTPQTVAAPEMRKGDVWLGYGPPGSPGGVWVKNLGAGETEAAGTEAEAEKGGENDNAAERNHVY